MRIKLIILFFFSEIYFLYCIVRVCLEINNSDIPIIIGEFSS